MWWVATELQGGRSLRRAGQHLARAGLKVSAGKDIVGRARTSQRTVTGDAIAYRFREWFTLDRREGDAGEFSPRPTCRRS